MNDKQIVIALSRIALAMGSVLTVFDVRIGVALIGAGLFLHSIACD